jgi:ABC-type branched-subunit amino acid transport system ATPase component/ABC-type branched-subunit amino acid transport system permease subunit
MLSRNRIVNQLAAALCFCVVFAAASYFVTNSYYQIILASVGIWASVALAWNIFSGYVGLISFGHAAFFGIGAYTVTVLITYYDVSPWIGIAVAPFVGALAAVLIGLPTFRLRSHYFAIAMLVYPLSLLYLLQWLGFQEASLPIKAENKFAYMQFSSQYSYTVVSIAILFFVLACAILVHETRFGLVLRLIKQNEAAAAAAGINAKRLKLLALMLSGALTSVAGGFYIVVQLVATPAGLFDMLISAQAIILSMFGGLGTVWGPIIGAVILVPLSEFLHAELGETLPGIQGVIYGIAIVAFTLWLPEGLFTRLSRTVLGLGKRPDLSSHSRGSREWSVQEATLRPSQTNHSHAIVLEGVSCKFGGVTALDRVSFEVEPGSIIGLVGPNGAGKTTVFNAINGFTAVNSGAISLFGTRVERLQTSDRARLGLGRTFQVPRLFESLSVYDNVLAGVFAKDIFGDPSIAEAAIKLVGLEQAADKLAGSLPAIETRLIELARALAGRPSLILLDEILAGLSGVEIPAVLDAIKKARDLGITVIIIEHTMDAIIPLVDRLIVLDRGRIIGDGPPRSVIQEPHIIEAYLGKKWALHASAAKAPSAIVSQVQ